MPREPRAAGKSELVALLDEHSRAWTARPVLRRLYREWFEAIVARLSGVGGTSIELGSGLGKLRDVAGTRLVLTDVEPTPWVDAQADALDLPYADASLANIVMVDVFHHLGNVARFLDEAERALAPRGRVVLVEPYCSPVSTPLYRRFHHERTDPAVDPFTADTSIEANALASNQALATLVFFRHVERLRRRWPALRIVERKRFALVLYPLSGGFSRPSLIPARAYSPLRVLETLLRPLAPALAFRCLVVLEKTPSDPHRPHLQLVVAEDGHPQEKQTMAEPRDVRPSVRARGVPHGNVDDPESSARRPQ